VEERRGSGAGGRDLEERRGSRKRHRRTAVEETQRELGE